MGRKEGHVGAGERGGLGGGFEGGGLSGGVIYMYLYIRDEGERNGLHNIMFKYT